MCCKSFFEKEQQHFLSGTWMSICSEDCCSCGGHWVGFLLPLLPFPGLFEDSQCGHLHLANSPLPSWVAGMGRHRDSFGDARMRIGRVRLLQAWQNPRQIQEGLGKM